MWIVPEPEGLVACADDDSREVVAVLSDEIEDGSLSWWAMPCTAIESMLESTLGGGNMMAGLGGVGQVVLVGVWRNNGDL